MYPYCQADSILINAPDYNPDIDEENEPQPHNNRVTILIQGTSTPSNLSYVEEDEREVTPAVTEDTENTEATDWPDTIPVQILGTSSTNQNQDPETREN